MPDRESTVSIRRDSDRARTAAGLDWGYRLAREERSATPLFEHPDPRQVRSSGVHAVTVWD